MYEDQRFILIGRLEGLRVPAADADAAWIGTVREALGDGGERLRDLAKELDSLTSPPAAGATALVGAPPSPSEAPKLSYETRDKVVRLIATAIQRLSNDRADALSEEFNARVNERISELVEKNRTVRYLTWFMIALVVVGTGGSLAALGMTVWQGFQAGERIDEAATSIEEKRDETTRSFQEAKSEIDAKRNTFNTEVENRLKQVTAAETQRMRTELDELQTNITAFRTEAQNTLARLNAGLEGHTTWVGGQVQAHAETIGPRLETLTTQLERHEAAVAERLTQHDRGIGQGLTALSKQLETHGTAVAARLRRHDQGVGDRLGILTTQLERYEAAVSERVTKHDQKVGQRLGEVDGAVSRHAGSVSGRLRQNNDAISGRLAILETNTVQPAIDRASSAVAAAERSVGDRLQPVNQRLAAIERSIDDVETNLTSRNDALKTRIAALGKELTEVANGLSDALGERQRKLDDVVANIQRKIDEIDRRVDAALEEALRQARSAFDRATEAGLVHHEATLSDATPVALAQLATVADGAIDDFKTDAQGQRDRLDEVWVQEANFMNGQRQAMHLTWSTMAETADVYAAQARAAIDTSVDGAPARVEALEGRVVDVTATVDELSTRLDEVQLKEMVEGVTRAIGERQRQLTEATTNLRTTIDGIDTAVAVVATTLWNGHAIAWIRRLKPPSRNMTGRWRPQFSV
jgi:hypothetical protein